MKRILIIGLLGLFIACGKKSADNQKPEMYKDSELAVMMRQMHADNEVLRERLMRNELPDSFSQLYTKMVGAEHSDGMELGKKFESYAYQYSQVMKALEESDTTMAIAAYNIGIKSCVSCHEQFCQGPIQKIERLIIN